MKKRILSVVFVIVLLVFMSFTAFAASPQVAYESSYDADTNIITVNVYVKNAVGAEAGNLSLAFDETMYEFDSFEEKNVSGAMTVAGKDSAEEGLCNCAFLFTDSCTESNLDEDGNLQLASFTFKPLSENYDLNDFCLWAYSFDVAGRDIASGLEPQGNVSHISDSSVFVTLPDDGDDIQANINNSDYNDYDSSDNAVDASPSPDYHSPQEGGTNWYVYVIAGVLVVGAVAGIAMVAVKNNRSDNQTDENDDGEEN